MTVEVATYIADLQPSFPPATDPRAQGDDHLRLIKQVLQNSFAGSTRQFQVPGARTISASGSILKADGGSTLYVSTVSGSVALTLPGLVAVDAGWRVNLIKTGVDVNPIFILPPAGSLSSGGLAGLSRARRAIPGVLFTAVWDGSGWFVARALALPIGSCIEYHGATIPAGYEWPNGQTLSSASNYPEYNAVRGGLTTLDRRGYVGVALDNMGGSAAGRLPGGIINGTAVGNVGGTDTVTLSTGQIPAHQHPVFLKDLGHSHTSNANTSNSSATTGGGGFSLPAQASATITSNFTGITIGSVSGVASDNQTATAGGGAAHSNLQPSVMVNMILVVE